MVENYRDKAREPGFNIKACHRPTSSRGAILSKYKNAVFDVSVFSTNLTILHVKIKWIEMGWFIQNL